MARTYRRRSIRKLGDLKQLGVIVGEGDMVFHGRTGLRSPLWDGASYDEYLEDSIRKFRSDLKWGYVSYSTAPRWFRNLYERSYRQRVRTELARWWKGDVEEPLIPNKPNHAGWDYW